MEATVQRKTLTMEDRKVLAEMWAAGEMCIRDSIKNARKLAGKDDLAKRRQAEIDASVDEAREFNLGTDERRLAIQDVYKRQLPSSA